MIKTSQKKLDKLGLSCTKFSGHRSGGSTVSDIASVHVLTDPAAPDERTYSEKDNIANQKTGI